MAGPTLNFPTDGLTPNVTTYTLGNRTWLWNGNAWQLQNPNISGYTGSQGDIGYTGSAGDLGYTGSAGDVGYTGSIGYTGSAGELTVTTSATPPGSANDGDIWIDEASGVQYFYFTDGDSSQWVEFGNQGLVGTPGQGVPTGGTAGQVLAKIDSEDYNTEWVSGGGGASNLDSLTDVIITGTPSNGEVLTYDSAAESWVNSASGGLGYTGSQGDIGYTGSQGDIGYTGSASTVIGYTGSASTVIGYAGSKGDIGYTGSAGTGGGGGGTSWQAIKTSAFNATAGEGYFVNTTSAAITATLPASPTLGDEVVFVDYAGTFDTNNLTVARNGNPIQGSATDLTVSTERAGFTLVFVDSTQGWVLKDK